MCSPLPPPTHAICMLFSHNGAWVLWVSWGTCCKRSIFPFIFHAVLDELPPVSRKFARIFIKKAAGNGRKDGNY